MIKKIINYIKKTKDINNENIKFCYGMTTNGTLLNKEIIDYLVHNKFNLSISLDGNKYHNEYRVFKNGKNSFDILFNNILIIKNSYPDYYKNSVNFNVVLHNKNPQTELIDFFLSIDKYPRISNLSTRNIDIENLIKLKKIVQKLPNKILKPSFILPLFTKHNSSNIVNDYLSLKNLKHLHFNNEFGLLHTGTCFPFSRRLYIKNDGYIYPCERIGNSYFMGKIDNNKVNIDPEKIAKRYNNYLESLSSYCLNCYNNLSCSHCMFFSKNDINKEIYGCDEFMNYKQYKNYLINIVTAYENLNNKELFSNFINHTVFF